MKMKYTKYKKIVIQSVPETEGLEYRCAVAWLHREFLPIGVVSLNGCKKKIIKIPEKAVNQYGNTVSVIAIGRDTFINNTNVTDIILGHNIEKIGGGAFAGCTNLERITIPRKIKRIGQETFKDCTALSDIYYEGTPEEWKKIDKNTEKREVELGKLIPGSPVQEVIEKIIPVEGNEALTRATVHFNCDLP